MPAGGATVFEIAAAPIAAPSATARIEPVDVLPSSIWMSSCLANLPRMPAEHTWYVPVMPAIWMLPVVALEMPSLPPVALVGMYVASVTSVGPDARFARRTCCQKRIDSSPEPAAAFHAPLITPLPTGPTVDRVEPVTWVVTCASSPGSDLNLSW